MKIKKGDKVKVIAGSSKGSVAEVIKVFPKTQRLIVEGVNVVKKHLKPTQMNPDGGIVEKEASIHVSNVALYDEKAKTAGKVRIELDKNGKKVRVFKKTGAQVK